MKIGLIFIWNQAIYWLRLFLQDVFFHPAANHNVHSDQEVLISQITFALWKYHSAGSVLWSFVCVGVYFFGCLGSTAVSGCACIRRLKDEPKPCYQCFEKCQTASSSTVSHYTWHLEKSERMIQCVCMCGCVYVRESVANKSSMVRHPAGKMSGKFQGNSLS